MVRKDQKILIQQNKPKKSKSDPDPNKKLTKKQLLFAKEYLIDRNKTQAAIRAGYSTKNASQSGAQLYSNIKIRAFIDNVMIDTHKRLELSADRTLLEINRLATFDIRRLYKIDGSLIPIPELDDDMAACVKGVEFKKVGGEWKKEYKIWNKEPALVMMKEIQKLVKENTGDQAESQEIEFVTVSARRPERGVA